MDAILYGLGPSRPGISYHFIYIICPSRFLVADASGTGLRSPLQHSSVPPVIGTAAYVNRLSPFSLRNDMPHILKFSATPDFRVRILSLKATHVPRASFCPRTPSRPLLRALAARAIETPITTYRSRRTCPLLEANYKPQRVLTHQRHP